MIEIIKELDIEVTKPNIFQAIVAKQYDMNTRFLKVTFRDCGTRIDIPNIETAKVVINAERKDGQSKGFEGVINEDGTVTVPLHSWMLELDGTVICDISVIDTAIDDNKKLTTTSFTLLVEKAAFGGTDITSDPQFDVLVALMDAATVAQEALDKSNEALKLVADCEEATENANAVREEIEAGGYIESLKEMNNGGKFSFWVGTQAEYDKIPTKVNDCLYLITDSTDYQDFETLKQKVATDYVIEQGHSEENNNRRLIIWTKWASGMVDMHVLDTFPVNYDSSGTVIYQQYFTLPFYIYNITPVLSPMKGGQFLSNDIPYFDMDAYTLGDAVLRYKFGIAEKPTTSVQFAIQIKGQWK